MALFVCLTFGDRGTAKSLCYGFPCWPHNSVFPGVPPVRVTGQACLAPVTTTGTPGQVTPSPALGPLPQEEGVARVQGKWLCHFRTDVWVSDDAGDALALQRCSVTLPPQQCDPRL